LVSADYPHVLGEFEEIGYLGRVVLLDLLVKTEFHWDQNQHRFARSYDLLYFAEKYAAVLTKINVEVVLHL
jgi:hypothetical protein